jgi:hypothetical protein
LEHRELGDRWAVRARVVVDHELVVAGMGIKFFIIFLGPDAFLSLLALSTF